MPKTVTLSQKREVGTFDLLADNLRRVDVPIITFGEYEFIYYEKEGNNHFWSVVNWVEDTFLGIIEVSSEEVKEDQLFSDLMNLGGDE